MILWSFLLIFFLKLGLSAERVCEYMETLDCYNDDITGVQTAVSVALDKENIERFSVFGWYFKQEGIECDSLVEDSAKELGVDKSKLSVLCPVK